MEMLNLNASVAKMRIRRLVEKGVLEFDDNFVRCSENKGTSEQGVPSVPNVTDVPDVPTNKTPISNLSLSDLLGKPQCDTAQPQYDAAQASLPLDCPPPRPQYYGHYDEDEQPF